METTSLSSSTKQLNTEIVEEKQNKMNEWIWMLSVWTYMVAQKREKAVTPASWIISMTSAFNRWQHDVAKLILFSLSVLFNFLMSTASTQPPARWKEKDEHEWTTPEQKAHLLSKQVEYNIAQSRKCLSGWFTVKLQTYFDLFPTEDVIVGDDILKPGLTFENKRHSQEVVSDPTLNRDMNTHHSCANRGSEIGLKTTIVLQHKHGVTRMKPSNSKKILKSSVTSSHSRSSITRITIRNWYYPDGAIPTLPITIA